MAKNRNDRPASARAARELLDRRSERIPALAAEVTTGERSDSGRGLARAEPELAFGATMAQTAITLDPPRKRRYFILACIVFVAAAATIFALVRRHGGTTTSDALATSAPQVVPDASVDEPTSETQRLPPVPGPGPRVPTEPTTPHTKVADAGMPLAEVPDAAPPIPTPPTPTPPVHTKLPPITAANFRTRYEDVQRLLKARGTQEMWARFLGISGNAMSFPDKQRDAIERLTQLEHELGR
jgi:hypothetical protein